jgi:hypothetical protein
MGKDETHQLEVEVESMKKTALFNHPKSCPEGHRQISWHLKESEVYCWLCNRGYSMTECFRTGTDSSLANGAEPVVAELPAGAAG